MLPSQRTLFRFMRKSRETVPLAAVLTSGLLLAGSSAAQVPTAGTISGFPPTAQPAPQTPPRPAQGPNSVGAFVEGVSTNDAVFEVRVGQGRLLTTKEDLAARGRPPALIAVGDPTVIDFAVVGPRQIRIVGQRIGVTDLVITTSDNRTYSFEVRVVADTDVLQVQLRHLFPSASIKLSQVRDHIVVEGQARSTAQIARIMETIEAYLVSLQSAQAKQLSGNQQGQPPGMPTRPGEGRPVEPGKPGDGGKPGDNGRPGELPPPTVAGPEQRPGGNTQAQVPRGLIINLMRVPTTQQVLLKVRVAELNRTAAREIGADFLAFDTSSGSVIGTSLGSASIGAAGILSGRAFNTTAAGATIPGQTTTFGIFDKTNFEIFFNALRRNQLLKILAEPNLVALNGQRANFLAGGQFFIPTAQSGSGLTGGGAVTAQPVDFGVRLDFQAFLLDDDVIRLTVDPEVSQPDFSVATTLVAGGSPVPGLNKRSAHTTVELRPGQTLAIAGLMQVTLDGTTNRLPGLGDLPILGPFFSNTTNGRTEKELIVLVTPYLVEPMNCDQVPPLPGDEIKEPNDLEFFLLNRIEGRTGQDFRSTVNYDDAMGIVRCLLRLHGQRVRGPHGYCE